MSTKHTTLPYEANEQILDDLKCLISNLDSLGQISKLSKIEGPKPSITPIIESLSRQLELSTSTLDQIITTLGNLSNTQRTKNFTSKELFDAITLFLKEHFDKEFLSEMLPKWEVIEDELLTLFNELNDDHPLTISLKARKLTYTRQNLVFEQEILTDLRPVFNHGGDEILEGIVTHSLVIRHMVDDTMKKTHFTLDAEDINKLRKLCERAEKKALTLEQSLKTLYPINIVGVNENDE